MKFMSNKRKILKKLKKSAALREAKELDYNKDGSVQINVGLIEADNIFSPFAYKTYELLNQDVVNYINMCESAIPISEEVSVDIHTETNTSNEMKRRIRQSIKRHYAEDVVVVNKKLKKKTISGIIYILLGILILLAEAFAYQKLQLMYLDTILAVIGWMFLWDGIEKVLEERASLKRQQIRDYRLINARIHVRKYSQKIQRQYGIGDFEEEEEE